jgi:hypothetical protein
MHYQSYRAFRTAAFELLRRSGLAVIAATVMAMPAVAYAAAISCAPSTITAVPPPQMLLQTTGHGSFDMGVAPTFSPAPDGCPGFTATQFGILYEASTRDNGQPVVISAVFTENLSFAGSPQVASFASADGQVNYSDDLTLTNITVTTFVDDDAPLGAFAQTGPLPSGSSFSIDSDSHTGTATLFQPPPPPTLHFGLQIFLTQSNIVPTETFFIDFPGSLVAAIVPVVPEPGSLVLMASALGGLAVMVRRKRRA